MKNTIKISQRYSQTGVSLVELMVGLTIGLIITAGAFTILFSNQKLVLEKEVMDRSQENFRFASTTITRLVRQANELGIPANNNELIVTFDRMQRDCLGQVNNSWINTFKVNANNELLCVLNNDENLSYVLAKDISEIKFSYGIQNGVGANSLVYQPRFSGNSNTENAAVVNAWNTITSVLTQITVSEGNGKQPTIDFISTSHLLALTKLASSGGTSHANPPNSTTPINPPPDEGEDEDTPIGNGEGVEDGTEGEDNETPPINTDCSASDLNFIKVNDSAWPNQVSHTISNLGNKATVTVTVDTAKISQTWKIARDNESPQPLSSSQLYQLPPGGNNSMKLTLACGSLTRTIIAKAGK